MPPETTPHRFWLDCKARELAKQDLRLHLSVVLVEAVVLVNHSQEKPAGCWWIFGGRMVTSGGVALCAAPHIMSRSTLSVVWDMLFYIL